jgi:hypothetical protein
VREIKCIPKSFFFIFISIYSLHRDIHCANSQYLYIVHWLGCPLHFPFRKPLPTSLKAIARGFVILLYICVRSPPIILPHLLLLHSPSPFTSMPHCTYFIVLSFIFNSKVNVQKGFLMYPPCEYTLLWSVQPLTPLLLPSHSPLLNSVQYMSLCLLTAQM